MKKITLESRMGGIPTPLPSPGKRRRRLRVSEETEGEMTLERYLYNTDSYRTSSFRNPFPLPLTLNDPEPEYLIGGKYIGPLVSEIRAILTNHSIQESKVAFKTQMVSKSGYPGAEEPVLTLLVIIDQGLNMTASWAGARDELRNMFSAHGLNGVHIEMYDPSRAFVPWLLPLSPQDATLRHYEDKRAELLDAVKKLLGKDWIAMSVFGLGTKSSPTMSALVVLVRPGTFQDWNHITSALRSILQDQSIPIEFLPGRSTEISGLDMSSRLTKRPEMGSSIGQVGEKGSGSLGGFVLLRKNGVDHAGFLTTHHVVRPHSASEETMQKVDRHGYGPINPHVTTGILYPSIDDHSASKAAVQRELSQYRDHVKEIEQALERFEMKGQEAPQRQINRLEFTKKSATSAKRQEALIDGLPLRIGNVLYSSGQALSSKKTIIDWAFVEFAGITTIPIVNRLPKSNSNGLNGRLSDYYGLKGHSYEVAENDPAYTRHFAEIEKGGWYFKIGRTTSITAGVCHGTEIEVSRQDEVRWDHQGNKVVLGQKSTSELIIVGKSDKGYDPCNLDRANIVVPETFCDNGDSGSFVLNKYGEVAGLLYGKFSGILQGGTTTMNAGLVTSMDEVLASIEAKTGGELVLA